MARIGLVIRPGIERAKLLAGDVVRWARENSHQCLLEHETALALGISERAYCHEDMAGLSDVIVALGGDGTILGVARFAKGRSPVLVGVNFGTLGFLAEIAPQELFATLEEVLSGHAVLASRAMLQAQVIRGGGSIFTSQALNEVAILKGPRSRLLDIDFGVNGEDVMRLRADGLIIATPTGSTAYSLSAGGSIVYPSLEVVLVTPLCPHSLTMRPLIFKLEAELEASIPHYEGEVYINVDGQVSLPLTAGDRVRVVRSQNTVRFARSPHKSYFEILRRKLNWGIANKGE